MGLDMYAHKTKRPIAQVDFDCPDDAVQISYWRKHPNLHGWMEQRYRSKGGNDEVFNCVPVKLDMRDIDTLEHAVNSGSLPFTAGFFFGESQPEDKADDLAFIKAAREALNDGYSVFYSSWW